MSVVGDGVGAGMTQTDAVLEFLRSVGPLTQPVAQEELGCLRLGARIWDLKQRGFAISTELVELESGQRVAEYSLGGSSTLSPGGSSTLLPGKGEGLAGSSERGASTGSSTPLPGRAEAAAGSSGRGSSILLPGEGSGGSGALGGVEGGDGGGSSAGSGVEGVGLRDGVTLDVALGVFGDLVMEFGVSPTVREFGRALGVSSESVAYRWVRVLEGEGLLCVNERLGQGAEVTEEGRRLGAGTREGRRVSARGWVVSAAGFERLYGVERRRRVELERVA